MIKTYKANTIITLITPSGKLKFMANSKGGSSRTTSNEKEQELIENSTFFVNGIITLESEVEEEVKAEELATDEVAEEAEASNVEVYADVTKCVDAIAILREKGATCAMATKSKINEVASTMGVSFPNL